MLCHAFLILDPISAVFESMSGLTTTGATAITNLAAVPKTVLFGAVLRIVGWYWYHCTVYCFTASVAGGSVHL